MRISDGSSDVCSSDLQQRDDDVQHRADCQRAENADRQITLRVACFLGGRRNRVEAQIREEDRRGAGHDADHAKVRFATAAEAQSELDCVEQTHRSEEHTSELQSLMRTSYAVFCLKKK